jgi:hypothetical protein
MKRGTYMRRRVNIVLYSIIMIFFILLVVYIYGSFHNQGF